MKITVSGAFSDRRISTLTVGGNKMVKGVNKTIIEVNNTGSKIFEKIVFYVTPQYGGLSPERLQKAAGDFTFRFDEKGTYAPLRRRCRAKRRRKILLAAGLLLAAGIIAALRILL